MSNCAPNSTSLFVGLKFCFLVFVCQLISLFSLRSHIDYLNTRLIFGLVGSNTAAMVVALAGFIGLIYFGRKKKLSSNTIVLISVGLFSNFLDRAIYGGTVDYISILFVPVFNLPDIFIITGLALTAHQLAFNDQDPPHL